MCYLIIDKSVSLECYVDGNGVHCYQEEENAIVFASKNEAQTFIDSKKWGAWAAILQTEKNDFIEFEAVVIEQHVSKETKAVRDLKKFALSLALVCDNYEQITFDKGSNLQFAFSEFFNQLEKIHNKVNEKNVYTYAENVRTINIDIEGLVKFIDSL